MFERPRGVTFLGICMNKSQIVEKLAEESDQNVRLTERVVNYFFNGVKDALNEGDKVEIRGFGSFFLKEYGSYVGRNPKTGDRVEVPPKRLPVFRVGKDLRERVKSSDSQLQKKSRA